MICSTNNIHLTYSEYKRLDAKPVKFGISLTEFQQLEQTLKGVMDEKTDQHGKKHKLLVATTLTSIILGLPPVSFVPSLFLLPTRKRLKLQKLQKYIALVKASESRQKQWFKDPKNWLNNPLEIGSSISTLVFDNKGKVSSTDSKVIEIADNFFKVKINDNKLKINLSDDVPYIQKKDDTYYFILPYSEDLPSILGKSPIARN